MPRTEKVKLWYGDVPNRKCPDCGELEDLDERLRHGLVAVGGPTVIGQNTPLYDPGRNYGNTPEGLAEQAKLQAHAAKYHQGGLEHIEKRGAWTLEVHRYTAGVAASRRYLLHKLPSTAC